MAAMEQRGTTVEPRIGGLKPSGATQLVVSDNWGGLFDGGEDCDVHHSEAGSVVADNWGGLFEPSVHILEEHDLALSTNIGFPKLQSADQIRVESCLISTSPDALVCVTPAPTGFAAASTFVRESDPTESSPAEYQRQIQSDDEDDSGSSVVGLEALHSLFLDCLAPVEEKLQGADIEAFEEVLSRCEPGMRAHATPPHPCRVVPFAPASHAMFDPELSDAAGAVLHFSVDCVVDDCVGSILVDSTTGNNSEKVAPLTRGVRGLEVVDVKAKLDDACPGVVSRSANASVLEKVVFLSLSHNYGDGFICSCALRPHPDASDTFRSGKLREVRVASGVVPAGARGRLPAPVRDHRAHAASDVRITFDIDPRDADPKRAYAMYAPVQCTLRVTSLGGYDGSLDDDPEFSFTYHDAPLIQAVNHDGQELAAAAALRADAVGAAGGGHLTWVEVVASAQSSCSTVCPAGDRCFADVPVITLWKMLRSGGDFTNLCDSILSDALIVFVRCCAVNVVDLSLLSDQQPWPPPPLQVEFVSDSIAIQPTSWIPPDYIIVVLQLGVNCLPSWHMSLGIRGCFHWAVRKCRADSDIIELPPDIGISSCVFAVKCRRRGSLLGSVELQLSGGDWESYFQSEAPREAMNADIFITPQESVYCSTYVQNFCQELIYLGSSSRGHVTILPVISRGKGFKFRNEDESGDAVLLVFANKQDLPNALTAAEITEKEVHYNADCLHSKYSTQEFLQFSQDLECSVMQLAWCKVLQLSCRFFVLLEKFWNKVWLATYTSKALCNEDNVKAQADKNIMTMMSGNRSDLKMQRAVSIGDATEFAEQDPLFLLEIAIPVLAPTDIWKWPTEFPDMLVVLLAGRGLDETMDALDDLEQIATDAKLQRPLTKGDIQALKSAISESCPELADKLAEAACQSSIVVLCPELQFLLSSALVMDLVLQSCCLVHIIRDFSYTCESYARLGGKPQFKGRGMS